MILPHVSESDRPIVPTPPMPVLARCIGRPASPLYIEKIERTDLDEKKCPLQNLEYIDVEIYSYWKIEDFYRGRFENDPEKHEQ